MDLRIGEIINIKGIEVLILDIINERPFVVALNTDIRTQFSEFSNNYDGSNLKETIDNWFKELDISAIDRTIDLITMDGSRCYNSIEVKAAPLTFDEFRKYSEIITPYIKESFWLATGRSDPVRKNWGSKYVCCVSADGYLDFGPYNSANGRYVVPAFIFNKTLSKKDSPQKITTFSTDELLAEISRRIKNCPLHI